jgi:alpha-ketoglutarate-dependent 2,4-dichlorophenoxyacetate dioxygenase
MFRFRAWRTKGALDIMTLMLNPLHPVFVAEATGLDLTKPISRADACEINAAMNRYGVPVWRGQH